MQEVPSRAQSGGFRTVRFQFSIVIWSVAAHPPGPTVLKKLTEVVTVSLTHLSVPGAKFHRFEKFSLRIPPCGSKGKLRFLLTLTIIVTKLLQRLATPEIWHG